MNGQGDCGCCAGMTVETPASVSNAPGLPSIAYRVGTQPSFKASLLARLSSTDFPSLAGLTARTDDDWTIALCDAFACAADVLTFYQQRIANESYLRTATERRSLFELARLIGYKPTPGVAASTALAFTLEAAPGKPALAAQPVVIPAGTRVQSIPDPGQTAQTFETVQDIPARVEWNAMPTQTQAAQLPVPTGNALWAQAAQLPLLTDSSADVYVAGTGLQIQPGDAIALVGGDRYASTISAGHFDVQWLDRVEEDSARNLTRLCWGSPSPQGWDSSATQDLRVYVFRQRAALFGAAAPDANLVYTTTNQALFDGTPIPGMQWNNFSQPAGGPVDLDALYPKVVEQGWFVLHGVVEEHLHVEEMELYHGPLPFSILTWRLYRAKAVHQVSRSDFALAGKITRIEPEDATDVELFQLRDTLVLAQSEELTLAPRPLKYPVFGNTLVLAASEPDIAPGQKIAVTGKPQRVDFPRDTSNITFEEDKARQPVPGESFLMQAAPEKKIGTDLWQPLTPADLPGATGDTWRWTLADHDGTTIHVHTPSGTLCFADPLKDDLTLSEVVTLGDSADAVATTSELTALQLQTSLAHCYNRLSFAANANVADATHGESVSEIAGSGSAGQANQSFQPRQTPLTYVSSASADQGAQATLQVRANNLLWQEVPSLYAQPPKAHVYTLRQDDTGTTTIQFGDGTEGARLPSGQNNVRLAYRKGLGTVGNLRAGQLTSLLTRPLGVKAVVNANDATGGQDPESLESARFNAPLPILTLGRAVSEDDYANYARAFAGIAKAYAMWIDSGAARGIYVTVAGADGGAIPDGSDTQTHLVQSLRSHGDPLIPLSVKSYAKATFTLQLALAYAADADPAVVDAAVTAALRRAFDFAARDFGQAVTIDEVYAVIQDVEGVLAADIAQLYRMDTGPVAPQPATQLIAALPSIQGDGSMNAAELLIIDPAAIVIGAMT